MRRTPEGRYNITVYAVDNNSYLTFLATGSYGIHTSASWSSYGPYIGLAAPGVSIYTTLRGGGYSYTSGTSFAAPLTTGLAALIFSANPSLTPQQVEQILKTTAVDLGERGYDVYYGWGRINASEALIEAAGSPPPPTVTITYPKDGTTISDSITTTATPLNTQPVSKVTH